MRNAHAMLSGLVLVAGAFTSGCRGSATDPAVGSSEARLVVSAKGNGAATFHVTAVDDAIAIVVVDQTIEVSGGHAVVVPVIMTPSRYTFAVDVAGSGDAQPAHGSAQVNMKDGETAQIALAVALDDGPTNIQITVDAAPRIKAADVTLEGGLGADQSVQIYVDAIDEDSSDLSFFWSGAGLSGAVQGPSTLSIPAAAVAGSSTLHVVVQDPQGATAQANIALAISGDGVHSAMSVGGGSAKCDQAQADCNASCDPALGFGAASADAWCLASCGMSLALCEAP